MVEDRKTIFDDAIAMIAMRNDFYRKKFHLMVGVFFVGLLVIGVLAGMLTYIVKHPPAPIYFVTDDAGRFLQDIPLTQPNMSTDEVTAYVVEAVQAAYSYDFLNYRAQLQDAQKYFTDYGWRSYMKGLEASNNLLALSTRKQVVIAKVIGAPKLIIEGGLGKTATYAWKFQLQMLVTYLMPPAYDDKTKFENPLIVTIVVERQSILSSYKGLGIVQLVAQLAQASPTQSLPARPS